MLDGWTSAGSNGSRCRAPDLSSAMRSRSESNTRAAYRRTRSVARIAPRELRARIRGRLFLFERTFDKLDTMATWSEFAHAAPSLAAGVRGVFHQYGPGLGYLATIRPDGGPRLHPVSPVVTDDGLFCCLLDTPEASRSGARRAICTACISAGRLRRRGLRARPSPADHR